MQVHCVSLKHLAKEALMPVAENFEKLFRLAKTDKRQRHLLLSTND